MSWLNANQQPSRYPQPYGYPPPHPYPPPYPSGGQAYPPTAQSYPPPRQPVPGPAPWPTQSASQANPPTQPAPGHQPLYQVRIRKHTGAAILMFNQTYPVTGTFAQCEAALHSALRHNLLAGWWSVYSILIWNWIALIENHNARKNLHRQARRANTAQRAS